MKFGAHCYIFTDRWTEDSLDVLDRAKALGVDVFEIGVGDDVVFDPTPTRRRAEHLGIELTISPGAEWPLECDISSEDRQERAAGVAWHEKQIDLASKLGATAYTGAIYGHTGVVKKRRPHPDEYAWMVEGLRALGEYGARRAVRVVIEPMSHFRTHLVNTPAQARRLLDRVDHPNVGALFDTYHMVTEVVDYASGLKEIAGYLWGIHACENNRGVPGRGLVPWETIFHTLKKIEFDGYIMLESYNSSIGDFAYERGMFHDVCPDAEEFVTEGIGFIKSLVRGPKPDG